MPDMKNTLFTLTLIKRKEKRWSRKLRERRGKIKF